VSISAICIDAMLLCCCFGAQQLVVSNSVSLGSALNSNLNSGVVTDVSKHSSTSSEPSSRVESPDVNRVESPEVTYFFFIAFLVSLCTHKS